MTTILNTEQLAELLDLNPETVRRLVNAGTIPHHRIGNSLRFVLDDVLAATRVTKHPDDEAIEAFAAAMRQRMATKREEGREGWQDADPEVLAEQLLAALMKGSPVDVADWAMMLHALEAQPEVVSSALRYQLGTLERQADSFRNRCARLTECAGALVEKLPQPETHSWVTYHASQQLEALRTELGME